MIGLARSAAFRDQGDGRAEVRCRRARQVITGDCRRPLCAAEKGFRSVMKRDDGRGPGLADADDIAAAITWLLSDEARNVSGPGVSVRRRHWSSSLGSGEPLWRNDRRCVDCWRRGASRRVAPVERDDQSVWPRAGDLSAATPHPEIPRLQSRRSGRHLHRGEAEGAAVGYKWSAVQGARPLSPFGHGLSIRPSPTERRASAAPDGRSSASGRATPGKRQGKEVVQVYGRRPGDAIGKSGDGAAFCR
ncbi:hypothetical protein ACRAWD_27475 [Caulobacter segnis]